MKVCVVCKEEKALDQFYKRKGAKDGRRGNCKPCYQLYQLQVRAGWTPKQRAAAKANWRRHQTSKTPQERCWHNQVKYWSLFFRHHNIPHRKDSSQREQLIASLGHTQEQFVAHMESQFTPEMNWDNYGEVWELDHILPRAQSLDAEDPTKAFLEYYSLKNLRPLPPSLNRAAGKGVALARAVQGVA